MPAEPLDDDYRDELPLPEEELICPHCGDYFVVGRCIRCELAVEEKLELLEESLGPQQARLNLT